MQQKKILYYVNSPWPAAAQIAEAAQCGASFRNVNYFDKPEECDGVMGAVPNGYPDDLVVDGKPKPKRGRPPKQKPDDGE